MVGMMAMTSFAKSGADAVCKRQSIAERILNGHFARAPRHLFDARSVVLIALPDELRMERIELGRLDSKSAARAAVAVVLGQVQDAAVLRDLHIEREPGFEPVFPIDLEAEKVHIELFRLGLVKNAKDRSCLAEAHSRELPRSDETPGSPSLAQRSYFLFCLDRTRSMCSLTRNLTNFAISS